MKKLILLIALVFTAFSFSSTHAASLNCSSINSEINNYSTYKAKVDTLFSKILEADTATQKSYHTRLSTLTSKYLKQVDPVKQKKVYVVLWYINCQNEKTLVQWREISHENMWKNPNEFKNGDYYFPNFKFSIPEDWEKILWGDRDDWSGQLFYDKTDRNNSISIFSHIRFKCPEIYTYCSWEENIERSWKEELNLLLDYQKKKKGIDYSITSDFVLPWRQDIYMAPDKKSYIFLVDERIVTVGFWTYNKEFIKRFFSNIKYDSFVQNNVHKKIIKDFWNGLVIRWNWNKALLYKNEKFLYESYISDLVPTGSSELITSIAQVEQWKSWIYVLINWHNWTSELLLFDINWENKKVLKEWFADVLWRMNKKIIHRFELMTNKRVKLFYHDWSNEIVVVQ